MMMSHSNTRVKVPNLQDGSGRGSNDSTTLNLDQRGVGDDDSAFTPSSVQSYYKRKHQKKDGKALVGSNWNTFIGTLNVRTIREDYKRLELATQFIRNGLEILGLQEHRIVHEEPIRIEHFKGGVSLVTISA